MLFVAESAFFAQPLADVIATMITTFVFVRTFPSFLKANDM